MNGVWLWSLSSLTSHDVMFAKFQEQNGSPIDSKHDSGHLTDDDGEHQAVDLFALDRFCAYLLVGSIMNITFSEIRSLDCHELHSRLCGFDNRPPHWIYRDHSPSIITNCIRDLFVLKNVRPNVRVRY